MRRPAVHVLSVISFAAALAACGDGTSAQPPPAVPVTVTTQTTPAAPTLTSASDRVACARLEANIRIVSQLVSSSVEWMTRSLHPKELARRTGDAEQNLLYSASVLSLIAVPRSLVRARRRLVVGLHEFAADFGRARASVVRGDISKAAAQLVDRTALASVAASTRTIDRACGA